MIESNLAVLLAERNLRITKVSRDTGISRTTLTALCNDYTGGIKFEVLDSLCKYLDIEPKDFFNYSAYEYELKIMDENWLGTTARSAILGLFISRKGITKGVSIYTYADIPIEDEIASINVRFELAFNYHVISPEEYSLLQDFLNDIGLRRIRVLKSEMEKLIKDSIDAFLINSEKTKNRLPDCGVYYTFTNSAF